tara:strand:- start:172 stop:576 length:405 start_codon:yes stop_codon:yes gene_type:complete
MILKDFVLSLAIITALLIYTIKLPGLMIPGADDLIDEYYYKEPLKTFVLDIFLVGIYIMAGLQVAKKLKMDKKLAVAGTTVLISGFFMLYFLRQKDGSSFFASWFHRAGWVAVMYDVIIVTSTYLLYGEIIKRR